MVLRHLIAVSLALVMAFGTAPSLLAQQQGAISGRATDEADAPYDHYTVQLRDPVTAQILATQVLDGEGHFSFSGLALNRYTVELIDTADDNDLVCSEGPVVISAGRLTQEVNIDCGGPPAALYLLGGAAGLVTAIGLLNASESGTGN
jgi:hypothetical protein